MGDTRLRLTITHKVGLMINRHEHRWVVQGLGTRDRATLWRMA